MTNKIQGRESLRFLINGALMALSGLVLFFAARHLFWPDWSIGFIYSVCILFMSFVGYLIHGRHTFIQHRVSTNAYFKYLAALVIGSVLQGFNVDFLVRAINLIPEVAAVLTGVAFLPIQRGY